MDSIIKSPTTLWIRWVFKKLYLEQKYRKTKLRLGYMADVVKCEFGKFNSIYKFARLRSVKLGDYSYVSKNSQIYNANIGKFTCIGPNVSVGLGVHPTKEFVSVHPVFYSELAQSGITFVDKSIFDEFPVTHIGNDVWIGANVILKDGISIGDGAIIAAGSVVTKDVEPFSIIGGVPAKLIRHRFVKEQVDFLLRFKWWDRDLEWIKVNKNIFLNIDLFMSKYENEKK